MRDTPNGSTDSVLETESASAEYIWKHLGGAFEKAFSVKDEYRTNGQWRVSESPWRSELTNRLEEVLRSQDLFDFDIYAEHADYEKAQLSGKVLPLCRALGPSTGLVHIALPSSLMATRGPEVTVVGFQDVHDAFASVNWSRYSQEEISQEEIKTAQGSEQRIRNALTPNDGTVEDLLRSGRFEEAGNTIRENAHNLVKDLKSQGGPLNKVVYSIEQEGTDPQTDAGRWFRQFRR